MPTLDYDAISPSQDEILSMFSDYLALGGETGSVVPIDGAFGAVNLPESLPKVVVSVDFCEVLRQTGRTCAVVMGNSDVEYPYTAGTGLQELEVMALVRALMKADRVVPAEDSEAILHIMQEIRTQGALIIGNTSTLAGCEEATLKFMSKQYPGAFDGINFNTGGHNATNGDRTKAHAVFNVLRQIDPTFEAGSSGLAVFSIDDRPHHNRSFDTVFAGTAVYTYAPRCFGEIPAPDHGRSVVVDTPLAAFQAMQHAAQQYLLV